MKNKAICLVVGVLFLIVASSCAVSFGDGPTSVPLPTYTPFPTYTPVPTSTPVPPTVTPVPTEIPPTAVPTANPFADWGAYKVEHAAGGFTMRFPSDWIVESATDLKADNVSTTGLQGVWFGPNGELAVAIISRTPLLTGVENGSLSERMQLLRNNMRIKLPLSTEQQAVASFTCAGGTPGLETTFYSPNDNETGGGNTMLYYICVVEHPNKGTVVMMGFYQAEEWGGEDIVFGQICRSTAFDGGVVK